MAPCLHTPISLVAGLKHLDQEDYMIILVRRFYEYNRNRLPDENGLIIKHAIPILLHTRSAIIYTSNLPHRSPSISVKIKHYL